MAISVDLRKGLLNTWANDFGPHIDDEHDDGYDDEVGYSYDSIGNSPSGT